LLNDSSQLHDDLGIVDALRVAEDPEQKWAILMRAVKQLEGEVLWIIDNPSLKDEETLFSLRDNCQLLISARIIFDEFDNFRIQGLDSTSAVSLFKHYYRRPDDNEAAIERICQKVLFHPLTIVLLAQTLDSIPNRDASYLLATIQSDGLCFDDQPPLANSYSTQKLCLCDCLMVASGIDKEIDPEFIPIMELFGLFPTTYVGHHIMEEFTRLPFIATPLQLEIFLPQLEQIAWLHQRYQLSFGVMEPSWQMHFVLQEIVRNKFGYNETIEVGAATIMYFTGFNDYTTDAVAAQEWRPYLETFIKKAGYASRELAWCYDLLGVLHASQKDYVMGLAYIQQSLLILEEILPPDHFDIAIFGIHLANTYKKMEQYEKAIEQYEKCAKIMEQAQPKDDTKLSSLYNEMGFVYQKTRQYERSLDYYKRSLAIHEEKQTLSKSQLMQVCSGLIGVYFSLSLYDEMIEHYGLYCELFA
ncbi:MAG TPA: tetratricopeptide repeat protein, partial [Chitinophagales bacterium]|nr:tetratricopeptide repeat protein [Chitinophagales bacterium]